MKLLMPTLLNLKSTVPASSPGGHSHWVDPSGVML